MSFEYVLSRSGLLVAYPEKALLDWLYLSGAARSVKALEERLFEDLGLRPEAFKEFDLGRLVEYARRMPGESFRVHFARLLAASSSLSARRPMRYIVSMKSQFRAIDVAGTIESTRRELAELGVERLRLFGSRARGDAREDSDIDLLVEFAEGRKSFDSFMAVAELLDDRFPSRVDLLTPESFDEKRLARILSESVAYEIAG